MTLYKDPPLPQQYWMGQVKCTSEEESLWKCPYVGISNNEECDDVNLHIVDAKLFTTGEVKLSLNLNGQRDVCAGVVEFSTANGIIGVCNDNWDRVKLQNFTTECFGDVSIDVNGINYEVCSSDSTESRKKMGKVVCRELGCGSLDVRLSDGLGRCSGRVEVKWEGSWRPISSKRNTMNSDVVCKHLNCGASSEINRQLFTEGEKTLQWLWDVSCRSSSAKLHECFENTGLRTPRQNEKNIEIICQKEELKFFEGDSPCKGKVRIKQFYDKAVWLPATPEKANDACKAMQCGTLLSFEPEQNTKDAKVTCSGTKTLALENSLGEKCWGMVKVCGDDQCGGVCSNNWRTDEDSKMICGNLGCGNPIPAQLPLQINNLPATYSSVYCSENVQNMIMCNFIPNKNPTCKSLAHVICTDSIKARLEDPRDKCAGNASLFYAGKWTPICKDSLDTNLKNLICKEQFCGENINDQHDWISQEESKSTGLSRIKCLDNANSVSECDLKEVSEKECIVGYLNCTGENGSNSSTSAASAPAVEQEGVDISAFESFR
ncbi:deleted in malignant brain tumors 1 protein-like [Carassius gibelio]|uniref:deleted in malignant brain tumors 1 protein-like n=1 Tax=Carassius gibelio TaxID=101364 RepID=UPI002278629F|nr:deleted in malignant brain tumors 1 protein-like [Carassius gibelio]